MKKESAMKQGFINSKGVYISIILLGIVSLMDDVVYEGARGLVPDYLNVLGATALIVGIAGGLGEFLGYAVRLISGILADTTRAYWFFIFLGYGLIGAIPLLGIAGGWEIAIILVLFERLGKAMRSPARDTVLSVISKGVGAGKAFGIHKFFDQIGAVAGPLLVAALMFYSNNNYQLTFSFLLLPFLMLVSALVFTFNKIGSKTVVEPKTAGSTRLALGKPFYIYTLAVTVNTIGLIPVALILYRASSILQPQQHWMVPLIYVLVQGVDASVALIAGYAYDKYGIRFLVLPFVLSVFPPLFAMIDAGLLALIIASIFFGVVLGMQESIYRAAVSQFTPVSSRGTAYGIFNTAYGVGFLISGGIYGALVDLRASLIITLPFMVLTQIVAIIALFKTHQDRKPAELNANKDKT